MSNSRIAFAPAPPSWRNPTPVCVESEQRRVLAIAAGKMGSWDWDWVNGDCLWDEGQYQILGVDPGSFELTPGNIQTVFHPDDLHKIT